MYESDISFDETNNELIIVCDNVYLQYSKNDPEQGVICIRRDNLPDTKITLEDWGALRQALSDYNAFISWAKAGASARE